MSFPETKFGICMRCGMDGKDQTADLTGADAVARSTTGNGVELIYHEGKYLCDVCINELKADVESKEVARRHAESERFRSKVGFVDTVED